MMRDPGEDKSKNVLISITYNNIWAVLTFG